jgi:hypothetical protein
VTTHRVELIGCVVLLAQLAFGMPAGAQSGGGYDLTRNTLDGGGATFSDGGGLRLGGTIGQADAGLLTGGAYMLGGGFWPLVLPPATATPSATPSASASATPPPSATATQTATHSPLPTASSTVTSVPPTVTATQVSTATATTVVATTTPSPTRTATGAGSPTHSPTATLSTTRTGTATGTPITSATVTPSATTTASQSTTPEIPSATPTATPTGTPVSECAGDCGNDGEVTINELLVMVNIVLDILELPECPAGDADGGGTITIDEILRAVNNALFGCPAALVCGGIAGIPCPGGAFCELPAGMCDSADLQGVCEPVPGLCIQIFAPVCGCDGVTYGNDCLRKTQQIAKDHDGACI